MKLSYAGIQDRRAWEEAGVRLPSFDWKAMRAETEEHPTWVHFGAGNIFRGFIARLQQPLLEQGLVKGGIIAADTFDFDIMDQIYAPHDSMTLMVSLKPDGSMEREVVASIAEGLRAGRAYPQDLEKLRTIFRAPSLQMVSFTITEKGYALADLAGRFLPAVEADFADGPRHVPGVRPAAGALPCRCRPCRHGQHGQLLPQRGEAPRRHPDRGGAVAETGVCG